MIIIIGLIIIDCYYYSIIIMFCGVYTAVPVFRDKDHLPRNMNVTVGDNVTLRCDAYADPPANITWSRDAQLLDR